MKSINMEVVEKLLTAKKLEKEALMMLLPERIQEHMEVISHEIKEMVLECILDWNEKDNTNTNPNTTTNTNMNENINTNTNTSKYSNENKVEASHRASKKATTRVKKIDIN